MLILCDAAGGAFAAMYLLSWLIVPVILAAIITAAVWARKKDRQRRDAHRQPDEHDREPEQLLNTTEREDDSHADSL